MLIFVAKMNLLNIKEENLQYPSLWILFGLFQPVIALMLYYLIIFIREEVKGS